MYAAARVLQDRGTSPAATLRMRHRGSATVSMAGVIGALAKLTIVEDDSGLRVVRSQPRTGSSCGNNRFLPLPIITDGQVCVARVLQRLGEVKSGTHPCAEIKTSERMPHECRVLTFPPTAA
jgi:hypothetical protein